MKVETIGKDIKVLMTPLAYMKMKFIVESCEAEVAWRGTASKLNDTEFLIEDVYLLKQTVTGVSVDIKAEDNIEAILEMERKADIKLDEMDDRGLYFHGHSHVNMGVSPSVTDEGDRKRTIDTNVPFYIWMIWNKKGDISCCVYLNLDMKTTEIVVGDEEQPEEQPEKEKSKPLVPGLLFRDVPFDIYISEEVKTELKTSIKEMVSNPPVTKVYTTNAPANSYRSSYLGSAYESAVSKVKGKSAKKSKSSKTLYDYEDDLDDYYEYIDTAEDGVPVIKESEIIEPELLDKNKEITVDDLWLAAETGTLNEKDLEKFYISHKINYSVYIDLRDINRRANTKSKVAYWPATVKTDK